METLKQEYYDKAFCQHRINGFRLKFENGNGISTIWGYGSYSENYDFPKDDDLSNFRKIPLGSNTVEIMPYCSEQLLKELQEKYPDNENGSIFGNLTINQWFEIIEILKNKK